MFFPFAWGLTMGAYRTGLPVERYWLDLPKYLVGAFILRGSAVTINDIFDRHVDANVERTKHRPLASGRISVLSATIFLLVQYAIGIIFLYFTQEGLALYIALFQLLPLFAIYPLLKRITYWPQGFLGIAMNFGFITSWIATTGSIDRNLILTVMTGCWFWTMMYDTIYACQDREDDIKTGVCSTAVLFGSWVRPIMKLFAIIFVSLLAVAGYLNQQGPFYYVLSVGGTAVQLIWRFYTLDLDVVQHCWRDFNRNAKLGWVIWAGLLLDYLTKSGAIPLPSM